MLSSKFQHFLTIGNCISSILENKLCIEKTFFRFAQLISMMWSKNTPTIVTVINVTAVAKCNKQYSQQFSVCFVGDHSHTLLFPRDNLERLIIKT